MGRLIPAGTGLDHYRNVFLTNEVEPESALLEKFEVLDPPENPKTASQGFLTN